MRKITGFVSAIVLAACQGASGPQGPAGAKGDPTTGPQGNVGPAGPEGDQGIPGRDATAAETAAILQASSGFKADLVDDLGADTAFGTRISTGAANRLAADATFRGAVTGGAVDLLAADSAFQGAVASKPALLDGVKNALASDAAFRDSVALTVSETTDLTLGECMTVTHGFNTYAVTYQALMSEGASVIPMAYMPKHGTTNLALNRPTVCSSTYSSGYQCAFANNGVEGDNRWLPATGTGGGDWQVDLGSVTMVSKVRLLSGTSDTTTYWQVLVSPDGLSFSQLVATASCTLGGSCSGYVESTFDPVPARWVRVHTLNGGATYHGFTELEVYGATYPIQFPNANQVKLCNYTGSTRRFTLTVSR